MEKREDTEKTVDLMEYAGKCNDEDIAKVPLFIYELEVQQRKEAYEKMEKGNKRMFVICLLLLLIIVGQRVGQWIYDSQFDDIIITQEAITDTNGDDNDIDVGIGDFYYGDHSIPDDTE